MRFAERTLVLIVCAVAAGGCGSLRVPVPGLADSVESNPVPAEALARFGQALDLMQAGDDRAERELLALARDFPALAGPCVNLGILYARSDRLEEAEASFDAALLRNPDSAIAHSGLGIVYRQTGRFAEANASYARAMAADPAYAPAYLNRGVLNDLYLQRPDAALIDYERYQVLVSVEDERVARWIQDLRLRIESTRTARSEAP